MKIHPPHKDRTTVITGEEIKIFDFSTCLKMVRCFGDSIAMLTICSTRISQRARDELDRYLSAYCAESVVELDYKGATLNHLTKPFTKVEAVHFSHPEFRCEPAEIQRCFPNLRALELKKINAAEFIKGRFPHLEHLEVYVFDKQREDFVKFLQSHPQLRSLHISGHNLPSLRMLSKCPQLESLFLKDKRTTVQKTTDINSGPIDFKTVKKFETDTFYLKQLDEANMSATFDQLDELIIFGSLGAYVVDFISKHPFISKLTWKHLIQDTEKETLLSLAKALPSVTELRMKWVQIPTDSVINFISECTLLQYLEFGLNLRAEYDDLLDSLGKEWRSSINDSDIVKLER